MISTKFFRIALSLIVSCGILTACSTQAPKKITPVASEARKPLLERSPETLIARARVSTDPRQRSQLLYQAAQLYREQGLEAQALAALSDIEQAYMAPAQRIDILVQQLDQAVALGNAKRSSELLEQLHLAELLRTDIMQQRDRVNLLEQAYSLNERHSEAAKLLIEQRGILLDDELYNNLIWEHLSLSDHLAMQTLEQSQNQNYDIKGWLSLLNQVRYRQQDIQKQHEALKNWLAKWPAHPASLALPHELELLLALPENQPSEVVLALPFSGPLASVSSAIRDGFIANYYKSSQFGSLNIRFYDTNKQDILALYEQALAPKSIVIGPLQKTQLKKLHQQDALSHKTIALNQITSWGTTPNLFQFSLSPEHESRQILDQLEALKQVRIAVIAPEEKWGQRIYQNLIKQLDKRPVQIVSSALYKDQRSLAGAVSKLLATDKSKARARKIRGITGERFESTPRRRQDIDAVVMIANAETARQLKPLLAFHYGGDLPVYASSQINSNDGHNNNKDLNGIRFLDMPWELRNAIDIKRQLETNFKQQFKAYSRFYALGADAYQLAPRIDILSQVSNSFVAGQTGSLSIDDNQDISRTLQWARFRKGKVSIN